MEQTGSLQQNPLLSLIPYTLVLCIAILGQDRKSWETPGKLSFCVLY